MIARLVNHVRTPLYRNGYSLVLSSFATSGLGIVYWILAARLYPVEVVGLNSAALSAIMFLAIVAQFNLVNALNRFLPTAGERTGKMILFSYLVNAVMGTVVSLVFLGGLSLWAPKLAFLRSSLPFVAAFVLSTVAWGMFALQDSALTGIRQAIWVPAKNTFFAVFKILLLIAFALLLPAFGILASWLIPAVIALIGINFLLFRRLIPRHGEHTQASSKPVEVRQVTRYVAGDYLGSLFWMAAAYLQPVIVTQLAGAEANAYFYLSWQIAYSLYLVSMNMGMSLIAEAAADPVKLNNYSFRVLKQSSLLIIPAVLVILVGAPWILQLFGRDYATEGVTLLRLLSLSAIPQMVVALSISIFRVQRNIKGLIATQATLSILVLVMIYFFLAEFGITGIGYAWLIGQSLIAAVLAMTRLRMIFLSQINFGFAMRVVDFARKLRAPGKYRQQVNEINGFITQIRAQLVKDGNLPQAHNWSAQQVVQTVNDVTIVTMGEDHQRPEALLKLANSEKAVVSLNDQKQTLGQVRRDDRLRSVHQLLPKLLAEGQIEGYYYMVEEMLPGVDARSIIKDPNARARMLSAAVEAIGNVHSSTASTIVVNDQILDRWVDDRLRMIRELSPSRSPLHPYAKGIEKLTEELHHSLRGKTVSISWIHGDFSPGNIMVTPDGGTITGIIDWDQAGDDVPMIDIIHLLLSLRILLQRRELGDVIRSLLEEEDGWREEELALLEKAQARLPGEPVEMRALLLLTWLHHITSNLSKSTRYRKHWLWVTKNVEVVLGSL